MPLWRTRLAGSRLAVRLSVWHRPRSRRFSIGAPPKLTASSEKPWCCAPSAANSSTSGDLDSQRRTPRISSGRLRSTRMSQLARSSLNPISHQTCQTQLVQIGSRLCDRASPRRAKPQNTGTLINCAATKRLSAYCRTRSASLKSNGWARPKPDGRLHLPIDQRLRRQLKHGPRCHPRAVFRELF